MPLTYKDTSSPIAEPLMLDDAKAQLNVDTSFDVDDDFISGLIVAARAHVENVMNRAMFPRSMKLWLDAFPQYVIRLPKPACLSVESISYIAPGGANTLVDPAKYTVDVNSEPARIVPSSAGGGAGYWPYPQLYLTSVVCVSYTAGSFVKLQSDDLAVPAAPGPYTVTLTKAADALGIQSLKDASGNAVAFTNTDGKLTVAPSLAGQTITAVYYLPDVPAPVRQAMLLLISHWYANRDAAATQPPKAIDIGVDALLKPYTFESFDYA